MRGFFWCTVYWSLPSFLYFPQNKDILLKWMIVLISIQSPTMSFYVWFWVSACASYLLSKFLSPLVFGPLLVLFVISFSLLVVGNFHVHHKSSDVVNFKFLPRYMNLSSPLLFLPQYFHLTCIHCYYNATYFLRRMK